MSFENYLFVWFISGILSLYYVRTKYRFTLFVRERKRNNIIIASRNLLHVALGPLSYVYTRLINNRFLRKYAYYSFSEYLVEHNVPYIIIVGKSCSGKDYLQTDLEKFGLRRCIRFTTRPKRPDERFDVDYHYTDRKTFAEKLEKRDFLEYQSYKVTESDVWHYGTTKDSIFRCPSIILAPEALAMWESSDELPDNHDNAIKIYLDIDEQTISERLISRGDKPEEANRRFLSDKEDFKNIKNDFDFDIIWKRNNIKTRHIIGTILNIIDRKTKEQNDEK